MTRAFGPEVTFQVEITKRIRRLTDADLVHLYTTTRRRLLKNMLAIEAGQRIQKVVRVSIPRDEHSITQDRMKQYELEIAHTENVARKQGVLARDRRLRKQHRDREYALKYRDRRNARKRELRREKRCTTGLQVQQ